MKLIVKKAGGGQDISPDYEYTDREAVARFAEAFRAAVEEAAKGSKL